MYFYSFLHLFFRLFAKNGTRLRIRFNGLSIVFIPITQCSFQVK